MKLDRIASVILFLFGAVVLREGLAMRYMQDTSPGPGFMPVWLGGLIMALSALLFLTTRAGKARFIENPEGFVKTAIVGVSFLVYSLVFGFVGMIASMAIYSAFLMGMVERRGWKEWLSVSAALSIGCYLLFKVWLGLQLPRGLFGI